ncbi:putative Receptor protein kinase [Melia azedarach]|uniref:Receptor protein kinase n=1 Tax=Melia azedarach TaxID=155640 RepID=A0ACC1Y6J4_MELAZ|nr:putative Receptor protein kinase [Melia azedarach]
MSFMIVIAIVSVVPLLCYVSFLLLKKLKEKVESIMNRQKLLRELGDNTLSIRAIFRKEKTQAKDQTMKRDLKIFDFQTIAAATDNFSDTNKLGQGGFGPVYKGKLLDGQEIAIKKLSKSSGQGIVEFKNEAKLIAKLQHTNLVRLLGCSLQGGERLLVYEYLPNKSLDFFIFDSRRKTLLNWEKRFHIIEGIAQGLLYLHKYSRLRVIHRDLKASNILLDEQMNPKISDFGMAKTFAMNELEANTNRIVGTHGYMSPEYVMNGIVSMKSDVYSFGVLVLEIVTSKKNNSCYDTERPLNLVGYAWKLWNEGKGLELIDPIKDESCSPEEALRCIHVGLLCVQDRATDRPTMSDVVSMLTNDSMALPAPKQPAFFINITSDQVPEVTEIKLEVSSGNDVTISEMEPR